MGRVGYPPVREIQVTTERKTQLLDITAQVREAVGSDAEGSAALVYVPHTTAGVTINEKIDPDLLADFEMALAEIVDDGWSWKHVDADGPNAPSHLRASVLGPQVVFVPSPAASSPSARTRASSSASSTGLVPARSTSPR